jgi:hypothetical protein
VSILSALATIAADFWRGFEKGMSQPARSAAQPAPLDESHPFVASDQFKATIAAALRGSFDEGADAERKRIGDVLQAPGVATYPLLAFELAIGGATVAQVAKIIARTEVHVQARLHPTEPSPLESSSSSPTLH